METTNLNIRTDKETKLAAEQIFEELGLNMTTAVNIFLRAVVREDGIPLSMTIKRPNKTTLNAIAEADRIAHDPNAVGYKDMKNLKAALDL